MVSLFASFTAAAIGESGSACDAEIDIAQIDAVVVHLPLDNFIGDFAAAITGADSGLRDLRVPQILLAEFLLGDFVKEALAHLVNGEHAFFRFCVLGDHAVERLRIGNAQCGSAAASAPATRAAGQFARVHLAQAIRMRQPRPIEKPVFFASFRTPYKGMKDMLAE